MIFYSDDGYATTNYQKALDPLGGAGFKSCLRKVRGGNIGELQSLKSKVNDSLSLLHVRSSGFECMYG